MFGEILNSLFKEIVGDDPQNRRIANLPLSFSKVAVGAPTNALGVYKPGGPKTPGL